MIEHSGGNKNETLVRIGNLIQKEQKHYQCMVVDYLQQDNDRHDDDDYDDQQQQQSRKIRDLACYVGNQILEECALLVTDPCLIVVDVDLYSNHQKTKTNDIFCTSSSSRHRLIEQARVSCTKTEQYNATLVQDRLVVVVDDDDCCHHGHDDDCTNATVNRSRKCYGTSPTSIVLSSSSYQSLDKNNPTTDKDCSRGGSSSSSSSNNKYQTTKTNNTETKVMNVAMEGSSSSYNNDQLRVWRMELILWAFHMFETKNNDTNNNNNNDNNNDPMNNDDDDDGWNSTIIYSAVQLFDMYMSNVLTIRKKQREQQQQYEHQHEHQQDEDCFKHQPDKNNNQETSVVYTKQLFHMYFLTCLYIHMKLSNPCTCLENLEILLQQQQQQQQPAEEEFSIDHNNDNEVAVVMKQIYQLEIDILMIVQWHVHRPTSIEYCQLYYELFPTTIQSCPTTYTKFVQTTTTILQHALMYDSFFISCQQSIVALCSILLAIQVMNTQSSSLVAAAATLSNHHHNHKHRIHTISDATIFQFLSNIQEYISTKENIELQAVYLRLERLIHHQS